MDSFNLHPSESIVFALRALYDRYGYAHYKMNKFEEYDLYARNKDFLISDGVITFTDTNGKLMALKPDVTLSIVKNTKDEQSAVRKLYYNENVYRVSKGTHSFKEIMQVGLEALGDIDDYCLYEVMKLAADSLRCMERRCVLEISHLGILSAVIDAVGIPADARHTAMRLIGEKNRHELATLCRECGVTAEKEILLGEIISLYGPPDEILPRLERLLADVVPGELTAHFACIIRALDRGENRSLLRVDFSAVDDLRYYNGFVFKGYVEGVPGSVLSGGQYDALMMKMKRSSGAVGFAVYLDMLEQWAAGNEYDVDSLLVYDAATPLEEIDRVAAQRMEAGESVCVQAQIPEGMKYRRLIRLTNGEVNIIENDA